MTGKNVKRLNENQHKIQKKVYKNRYMYKTRNDDDNELLNESLTSSNDSSFSVEDFYYRFDKR